MGKSKLVFEPYGAWNWTIYTEGGVVDGLELGRIKYSDQDNKFYFLPARDILLSGESLVAIGQKAVELTRKYGRNSQRNPKRG